MEPQSPQHVLTLLVVGGPAMERIDLVGDGPWVLGRASASDCVFDDPSISRRHAGIERGDEGPVLVDLESSGGILLNRIRVEPGHPEPLSDRDMIVIGPWTLLVRLVGRGQTEPSLESTESPRTEQPDDATREDALYATRDSIFLRLRADGTIDRELGWNEFAEKYSRVIAGFARNAGLRAQEIDDVLQDVLMGFFRVSADFNYDPTKGRFRGYLKRVTLNAIRSRFRRRRPDVNVDPEWELPAHDEASDAAWDRQWTEQLFFRAMDRVRDRVEERTWKSFELYGLRGTAIDAVAEETGMTPEAIRHAKMRITRQIRAVVDELRADEG